MSVLPIVSTQITLSGNVGSPDTPRESHLFTFDLMVAGYCTERVMNDLKNQQKIGEANGMFDLPIVPTQVTKTGNVGSVHVFTFGPRGAV